MRDIVSAHRARKRCRSAGWELFDLHLYLRSFQRTAHIIYLVSSTEEWVKTTIRLHNDLRYNGQFSRFDGKRTTLLRIEQILGYIISLINLAIERFAERSLLNIHLLTPKPLNAGIFDDSEPAIFARLYSLSIARIGSPL